MLAASKFRLALFRCYIMRAGQESGFAPLKKSIGEQDKLRRDLAQAVHYSTLKAALRYTITLKSSSYSSIRLSGRVQCLSLLKKHLEIITVRKRSECPNERIVTRTMGA